MRRYVYILLFFLVLIAPFLLRMVVTGDGTVDGDVGVGRDSGATPGGAARLVIITPHNQDIRNEFARAFSRWHQREHGQPVVLDFRVPGGTNDIKRVLDNSFRAYRDAHGFLPKDAYVGVDVAWGGGDYFFDIELKPLGVLQPMQYDPKLLAAAYPQPTLAGVKLFDMTPGETRPPTWVGVCLSSFGIAYNLDVCNSIGVQAPTAWHDLTNPRFNGMLALADPQRSGSASVAFNMVIQRAMADAELAFPQEDLKHKADLELRQKQKAPPLSEREQQELAVLKKAYDDTLSRGWKEGMTELLLIAANARYFTDMANNVPLDVGNGQAAAGMCIDFYGRVFEESVGPNRCKFVSPRAATAITPDPVAVLNGVSGPRLEIARHFVEFLLTREGQLLWIQSPGSPGGPTQRALRRPPIRRDLYVANAPYWTDEINPFAEAGGFNSRPEWAATMTETRLIWAAAWMDSRAELKSAYDAILKVPAGARRERLLHDLANLPIERSDVEQLRVLRKGMETSDPKGIEEWKAKQRIDWANAFRKHYRAVEEAAEH
jgi:iron(III) transport system substrate-binding protein